MPGILLYGLASVLYAALAVHFWRTRWSTGGPARIAAPGAAPAAAGLLAWERAALLAPLALHTWLLYADLVAPQALRFGFGQALSVMLWMGVLLYWVESLFYNLDGMQPLVLPLAALAVPLPGLFPGMAGGALAATFEFRMHLILGMLAYSVFTIAMLHAVLMAIVERRLHRIHLQSGREPSGALGGPWSSLPPLLTLERLLFRLIGAAFILLTLTLVTGVLFSETLFGRAFRFDHKTLFAILSWLTFAVLLAGRTLRGWRGRTALRWTLSGFALLMLAYVGSRFVLEVVLGRA
jgi:ABC-type uncharacterized transport system permease subunit